MTDPSRSDSPASAKVLGLVRLHHGLPDSRGGEKGRAQPTGAGADFSRPGRLGRHWQRAARLNHLAASRRRSGLEEIPDSRLPVVLELSGGRRCLLLLGRERTSSGETRCRVQFPDAREALVSESSLRESYDGVCVFLAPARRAGAGSPWLRRMRRRLAGRR